MAYYDALMTKWATLSGTTVQRLAAINAAMVAGPNVDVQVSQVVGFLLLNGAYLPLQAFALATATGDATHDTALVAAKTLMAVVTVPNAPMLQMSNPAIYAQVTGMAAAVLAQEAAAPGSTGFTPTVYSDLLALAQTTVPWWQSMGYTSPISMGDLAAAGGLA